MIVNGFKNDNIAHSYLFHGTTGTGKTTCARIIGMGLLCEKGPTSKPCGQCEACKAVVAAGSYNFVELNNASLNGVDAMRKLREQFQSHPMFGAHKVFVFDECHRLTPQSQDLLLKEVENASGFAYFIFCSTEPDDIIEPLRGRCVEYEFKPLVDDQIECLLMNVCEAEGLIPSTEVIHPIVEEARGRARNALNLLQKAVSTEKLVPVSKPTDVSRISALEPKPGKAAVTTLEGGTKLMEAAAALSSSETVIRATFANSVDLQTALQDGDVHQESTDTAKKHGKQKTFSPIILSASRRTDIPAFHSEWLFNRLAKGKLVYNSPFGGWLVTVLLELLRLIVFWTKDPVPMAFRLPELDERGIHYYFQFTLNDYEAEGLEPGLPNLHNRINSFQHLSNRIGKARVIWRADPLILTDAITPEVLIQRIKDIAKKLTGYTDKLVFSFFRPETHKKADRKLAKVGINVRAFTDGEVEFMAKSLVDIGERYGMTVAACAEQDLAQYSIQPNKCIDDELIRSQFGHDQALMDYLSIPANLKAGGQREACQCISSVDIGEYSTCGHGCLYCYANTSEKVVQKNLKKVRADDVSLLPARKTKKSAKSKINRVQDWSEKTINCCNGCSNGCLYCYARGEAVLRFGRLTDEEWQLGAVREKDVAKSYPKYDQTVMFPSTHDITEDNFEACKAVLGKLLEAGNRVLVVSKPRPELIEKLCQEFEAYKNQILFRFTIGTNTETILEFWEPNAPTFAERKMALIATYSAGFRTSVSMEPMLESATACDLVEELRPFVTQSIWIGTMNHAWYIKKYEDPMIDAAFDRIEEGQAPDRLQPIYDRYKDDPLVLFKSDFLKKLGLSPNEKPEEWPEASL